MSDQLDGQILQELPEYGSSKRKRRSATKRRWSIARLFVGQQTLYFSNIQKFSSDFGKLNESKEIVVLVDEAHRTQYKKYAERMRIAIPEAQYIAFTGTPLLGGNRLTNRFFGDYVSEYNFKQSYEDGSTVPLFYDKRVPEVQIIREGDEINADLAEVAEQEELWETAELIRLEREFATELSVIRNPARLKKIALDIVKHYPNRGYKGRGMIISIDRYTAIKMYDLVRREYWKEEIVELRKKKMTARSEDEKNHFEETIKYMNWVEMALVISYDKSEEEKLAFEKRGVDITPHIRKWKSWMTTGMTLNIVFRKYLMTRSNLCL